MLQPWMLPSDLAPGDRKSLDHDWSGVDLHRIQSADDPLFDSAFGALWAEFGRLGEVEQANVLAERLRWDGRSIHHGCALRYRLMLVTSQGRFAAVRDHTAIVQPGRRGACVHLSHNLVAPDWRRTGLAGWLRALPIQTARRCLEAQGRPADEPITLVGEMEHPDPAHPASMVRLTAYEKAGFRKVDPAAVPYLQPDFHSPEEIDFSGVQPIPMTLIVRRVGREHEETISGSEARALAEALYRMYATGFREKDMAPLFASVESYPATDARVRLLRPTEVPP